ncbi:hypothetical protein QZH41_001896 [Actinostola sp. cb2023]|nr:hypothetical protein QZH41_001896 [Actinostola sp. cb2023]
MAMESISTTRELSVNAWLWQTYYKSVGHSVQLDKIEEELRTSPHKDKPSTSVMSWTVNKKSTEAIQWMIITNHSSLFIPVVSKPRSL